MIRFEKGICNVCPAMDGLEMCEGCEQRNSVLRKCVREGIHMIPSKGILVATEVALLGMKPKIMVNKDGGGYLLIDGKLHILYYSREYDLHYIDWGEEVHDEVFEIPHEKRVEIYSKVFNELEIGDVE